MYTERNFAKIGKINKICLKLLIIIKLLMKQKVFRTLADLRFSIFILLLISICSIIGTIIEQDQAFETYKINYPLTNPIFGFLN